MFCACKLKTAYCFDMLLGMATGYSLDDPRFESPYKKLTFLRNRPDRLCGPPNLIFSVSVGVLRDCNNRHGVKYDLAAPYLDTVHDTECCPFFSWAKKDMVLKPSKTDIHFYISSCCERDKFSFHVCISGELQQTNGRCTSHATMRRAHTTTVAV